jgi:DNA-binding MarR family transcriptional regulator
MADAGLVERRSCKEDGRGLVVAVSKGGVKLRRRMWPVYADAIQSAIGAKLGPADAAALAGLLARLTEAEPAERSARG